jgi:hypothetical protein
MQLSLNREEATLLAKILKSYLSDLRMEIADTDSMDFREDLKSEEAFIKGLLVQLDIGSSE